ncbi:MAG TPA: NB-ARC domain-containing protein, partial [Allocoleopsis sp.]
MTTNITPEEIEFSQAANNWNLEKLYIDLATTKGKSLTPVEKKILRGLLCGYSPLEISTQVYHNASSSGVRVYLSNGLYKYIENLLTNQTGENVKIKNWSRVTNLLEKAGYKKLGISLVDTSPLPTSPMQSIVLDSPQVTNYNYQKKLHNHHLFYGRTNEVNQLQKWILDQNYRLIEVLGMVGIGKTALVLNVLPDIQQYFQFVLWRSLDNISTFTELITTLLQDINPDHIPEQISRKTNLLLKYLQQYRCLIILDRFDYSVGDKEQYINFFQRIGRTNNHSCMMITS